MSQNFATTAELDDRVSTRPSAAKYRIQISLTDDGKRRLDELVELTNNENATSVVKDALRLYDLLSTEVMTKRHELLLREEETGAITKLRLW